MSMSTFPEIEVDELVKEAETTTGSHDLIVYNDDVNTFDFVTNVLIEVCRHEQEQAEQCTMLIHYKGKCAVKKGTYDELVPMRNAICERGLSAEVE